MLHQEPGSFAADILGTGLIMFDVLKIAAEQDRDFLQRAAARMEEAMGPVILKAMRDPEVNEIMLNCDGELYIEGLHYGMRKLGSIDKVSAYTIVKTLASLVHQNLDARHPLLSGEIPFNGSRIEIQIPPVVRAPSFTIRKHNALSLPLSRLIADGLLTTAEGAFLREAVESRLSIVVSGSTGTGKTTLVNALLNELSELCPDDRVVNVEDTAELKVVAANRLNLLTADGVGMDALLRSALRSRPDRIVVGEIRGAEALDLIDAFTTGHSGGFATVHAGSVEQALKRLTLLVSRNPAAPRLIEPAVAEALDIVVQLERRPRRHVAAIARIQDFREGQFVFQNLEFEA